MQPTSPAAPVRILTIRDTLVRLYAHPSVEHGWPWCALADVAGLAGYPADLRQTSSDRWRGTFPDLVVVASDGTVIVSDAVVYAFLRWLEAMGLEAVVAIRNAYELETGRAYLGMTAGLPDAIWRDAVQRSALADALPDPAGQAN